MNDRVNDLRDHSISNKFIGKYFHPQFESFRWKVCDCQSWLYKNHFYHYLPVTFNFYYKLKESKFNNVYLIGKYFHPNWNPLVENYAIANRDCIKIICIIIFQLNFHYKSKESKFNNMYKFILHERLMQYKVNFIIDCLTRSRIFCPTLWE